MRGDTGRCRCGEMRGDAGRGHTDRGDRHGAPVERGRVHFPWRRVMPPLRRIALDVHLSRSVSSPGPLGEWQEHRQPGSRAASEASGAGFEAAAAEQHPKPHVRGSRPQKPEVRGSRPRHAR